MEIANASRTRIGKAVYDAKNNKDQGAIEELTRCYNEIIDDETLHSTTNKYPYRDFDLICAVPARRNKDFDLPTRIASNLSSIINKQNITSRFTVKSLSTQISSAKNLRIEDKWHAWEQAQIELNYDISGKSVLLIDDLYQSGISIQYVAMKLQRAGAQEVYGLCMTKTMRNTDNQ